MQKTINKNNVEIFFCSIFENFPQLNFNDIYFHDFTHQLVLSNKDTNY